MPKLDRFAKRGKPDPLEKITGKKEMKQILEAFRATERYVMLNLTAAGLL
ncbi:MAG: hypothetical protein LBI74_00340 [Synergistaceae bacterium]|nr:hypothetical protein [Synergistaceae bacterium]